MLKELYSNAAVNARIAELGKEITEFYRDKDLIVVSLLNGGMFFGADLIRKIDLQLAIDALAMKAYEGKEFSGKVSVRSDLKKPVVGRHVLLVDDIFDTGASLEAATDYVRQMNPASIRTCVLLKKQTARRPAGREVDWFGFEVPDEFIVGYGLDYDEKYRNLPYIGIIKGQ